MEHTEIESRFQQVDGTEKTYTKYEYKTAKGAPIGVVLRCDYINAKGKKSKSFRQCDFDKSNWRYKYTGDKVKVALYNQDLIDKANKVVLVEGEKCADALNEILPPKIRATTCPGGAQNIEHCNVSPLEGKDIVLWRDNDANGKKWEYLCTKKIEGIVGSVRIHDDWGNKVDAVDIIEKYGADTALKCLDDLVNPCYKKDNVEDIVSVKSELPFKVMGRTVDDEVVVYCLQDSTIRSFKANNFDENVMVQIYHDMGFWSEFCGIKPRSGAIDTRAGYRRMWKEVLRNGIYEPKVAKHGGIHKVGDKYVAHLGDRLYIDGQFMELSAITEDNIFVEDTPVVISEDKKELSEEDKENLIKIFDSFPVEIPEKRQLILGWAISSLLSPVLPKRPHIWFFAPANTGKTFITSVMGKLVGSLSLSLTASATTFAGLKQMIGSRGCAVFWDESEAQAPGHSDKWDKVMECVRISFDSQDGKIVQGTREQVAKYFVPRMMFCFSSIKMADLDESLASRMITVELKKYHDMQTTREMRDVTNDLVQNVDFEGIHQKVFHLVYDNADAYFKNLETSYYMFKELCGDDRRAYALAVCFSGYMLVKNTGVLSEEEIAKHIWKDVSKIMPEQVSEANILLQLILNAATGCRDRDGRNRNILFQDYIQAEFANEDLVNGCDITVVAYEFKVSGLVFNKREQRAYVYPSSSRFRRAVGTYLGINSVAPSLNGFKSLRKSQLEGFSFDISKHLW